MLQTTTTRHYELIVRFLIDTSAWIPFFRNSPHSSSDALEALLREHETYLSRFTQTELLQGCRNKQEWQQLSSYLNGQNYIEMQDSSWVEAARIYYDLRRVGYTVRSIIDCCIAQLALEHDQILVHCDRDFESIARVRGLECQYLSALE